MTGIYMIRFGDDENMHFYIGQSAKIEKRKRQHLSELRNGIHKNPYMQRAYNKYGEESMTFEVLCECAEDKLNELEEYYIYTMQTFVDDNPQGMNLNTGGGGRNMSDKTRAKISEVTKGKKRSAEARAKMSEANKGKKHSPETKAKMSEAKKGKKLSAETKAKISEAKKGNNFRKGRTLSPETRAKISEAKKGHAVLPETRAKISEAKKGKPGKHGKRSPLAGRPKVPVMCIETNEIFASCAEAGRAYDVVGASISHAVLGITKTCCGLHWKKYERSDGIGTDQ